MYIFKTSFAILTLLLITACGGGSTQNDTETKELEDTTKQTPQQTKIDIKKATIELKGSNPYYIKLNDTYSESGATVKDINNKDITSLITVSSTSVNTSITGQQTIIYTFTDKSGHSKTKKRKIIINNIVNSGKGVHVNEILTANSSTSLDPDFKQFSDWIELYNYSDDEINLDGYHLSDDKNSPNKYSLPNSTISAHGYKIIWADKRNTNANDIHTNFKLSMNEDNIVFSDDDGKIIDDITFVKQKSDISFSFVDGKILYYAPTPKSKNTNPKNSSKKSEKPDFLQDSGLYTNSQSITLTQKNGGTIYYTTNGSIPTKNSKRYSSPITIDKTTVIRARALEDDKFLSSVKSHTYLIDEKVSLPVISLAINDEYMFGNAGIYTNFDQDWMRTGCVEYIKDGKSQFSKNIGIRIFGHNTRKYAQKSLAIFTDKKYGSKSIKYQLFEDKPNIKKIKSFIIRTSGNDWGHTMMKDALSQTVVKDNMDVDYQSYQPAVLFINGKYWGIQNIREKINENYLKNNHGVDKDKVDILQGRHFTENENYVDILNYIQEHDLSNDEYFLEIASRMEITEYINYMIAQIYGGNNDWPYTNRKYWVERKDGAKWRWILFDLDQTYNDSNFDSLGMMLATNGPAEPNPPWATVLFRNLMKNSNFKNEFITRFTTHLNTTFEPNRVDKIITKLKNAIEADISRHFSKWGGNKDDWKSSVQKLYNFADDREEIMRGYIKSNLNQEGNNLLKIDATTNGIVSVDGVKLTNNYNGTYFNNATVTLKAIPDDGHTFVKWSDEKTNPEIKIQLNDDINIKAIFR